MFVCLPSATVVIVVKVGTPEHREVERRMAAQLAEIREKRKKAA